MPLALAPGVDGQRHQSVQRQVKADALEFGHPLGGPLVAADEDDARPLPAAGRGGGVELVQQAGDGDAGQRVVDQAGDPHAQVHQRAAGLEAAVPRRGGVAG